MECYHLSIKSPLHSIHKANSAETNIFPGSTTQPLQLHIAWYASKMITTGRQLYVLWHSAITHVGVNRYPCDRLSFYIYIWRERCKGGYPSPQDIKFVYTNSSWSITLLFFLIVARDWYHTATPTPKPACMVMVKFLLQRQEIYWFEEQLL